MSNHYTIVKIQHESPLDVAAQKLIEASNRFIAVHRECFGKPCGVVWLKDDAGHMIVIAGSDYHETLMRNIDPIIQETLFEKGTEEEDES